jgi:NADH-quinone oxidoreductase subunit H
MSLIDVALMVLVIATMITLTLGHVAYAVYFERKVVAHMQGRLGPMRVGPHGFLQPIADGIKLFFKEDVIPSTADKTIFFMAPLISAFAALASIAVVPFWDGFAISHINIGLLYILALSSVGAYGVILGGWSSNSKYAFLGSLRSAAQVISYEIAMGMSLIGVILLAGSTDLATIVRAQSDYPFVLPQFLGFFVFLMAAIAETNRLPFDLPEAETELVAGYLTEYTGFRFSLFFVAEYAGMFIMSALATVCFLGGWHGPDFWIFAKVPGVVWFMLKVYGLVFFYFWIRATLPRYRYDQLMGLGWKVFIPLAMLNIAVTGLVKVASLPGNG